MNISRRKAVQLFAAGCAAPLLHGQTAAVPAIASGPFRGTRESLAKYRAPEWFRDAKFGIWAHWGPQSAPEYGDWYARNMYIEGHRQYKYHVQKYGHPSRFGFKDVIPTWKAEKFDPEHLMSLYQRAGAKYFVSMGVHHDNFDLWNSRHNRWNAVKMGPRKDIVGLFRKAARARGLRFGVSEHLAVSYNWFQTSHDADKEGRFKGIPYDGADPKYSSLYHETHAAPRNSWEQAGVPAKWREHYFLRIKDLIDNYEPDLMYTDGPVFFEEWGLGLLAHHYNRGAREHSGKTEAVWANKGKNDCTTGTCVLDLERGVVDTIWSQPWQTDTCIGHWHYDKEAVYKSPKIVIDMLVDIVSRNGNLLLNFPLPSSGMPDDEELKILDEIARWMDVNGEAIYGTRPWKVFGEGPATAPPAPGAGGSSEHHLAAAFNERSRKPLAAEDIRFTVKGETLYAFLMGWPQRELKISGINKAEQVELLGSPSRVEWRQQPDGLTVRLSGEKPSDHAVALRIRGI